MAPLPSSEPFELLDAVEAVDVGKLRFERNRIKLPMGVEATFGMIRHPGASLAVPITDDGQVVLLRQYRFAVQARLLEFPAGTLEEGGSAGIDAAGTGRGGWLQRGALGCPGSDAALPGLLR